MSRTRIDDSVREVLQTVLDRRIAADEDVRRADEPRWDSLAHVNLVFSIESELGIQFGPEELDGLDSLERLVLAAEAHLRSTN